MSKKLTIFTLLIFVLVFASVGSASAYWASTWQTSADDIAAYDTSGVPISMTQQQPVRYKTATPAVAQLLSAKDKTTSTPLQLLSARITGKTSAPTAFSAATNTPTASPSPTVTPAPTHTPSPTLASTATSTVISMPAPIEDTAATPAISQKIQHVVIISIDGLRPDALDLADTPTLDKLRSRGAFSPDAQTVSLSITLPSHASMLTGMLPEKHGIVWGIPYIGWPGMSGPSLFSEAHNAEMSTAMVFGKQKMNYLVLPNSVNQLFGGDVHDPEVKEQAIEFINEGPPTILFIHFPDTDRVGHAYGWMSDNQLYAINFVDGLIGEIITTLEDGGYLDTTLLIVTSDHGGHENSHGDDSPLDRTIPWLAVGPGVPQGVILTNHINTYDTAATAAHALALPIPEIWDGKPVMEIFP